MDQPQAVDGLLDLALAALLEDGLHPRIGMDLDAGAAMVSVAAAIAARHLDVATGQLQRLDIVTEQAARRVLDRVGSWLQAAGDDDAVVPLEPIESAQTAQMQDVDTWNRAKSLGRLLVGDQRDLAV